MIIDIIQRAEELGSKAATQKGAVRFLLKWKKDNPKWNKLIPRIKRFNTYIWKMEQEKRESFPKVKRAKHDKAFRKKYLSKINRRIKRLVVRPGNTQSDYDKSHVAIKQYLEIKRMITGKEHNIPERNWMSTTESNVIASQIAIKSGLQIGQVNSSDTHSISVLDALWQSKDLAKYLAVGPVLALVENKRFREYAKSSDFKYSTRSDYYLVGYNENGNAFRHQVSRHCETVNDAIKWIFGTDELIARQGDIAVVASKLKNKEGEERQINIGGGHSRHIFIGEVYVNGSTHVRSGFLVHTGNQHPTIYLDGSQWVRLVAGKESEIGNSSRD